MTRVSDHALLRYLEHSHELDVEALRVSIATRLERAAIAAGQLGVLTYSVRLDGVQFIVRNDVVTTVLASPSVGGRFHALAPRELA